MPNKKISVEHAWNFATTVETDEVVSVIREETRDGGIWYLIEKKDGTRLWIDKKNVCSVTPTVRAHRQKFISEMIEKIKRLEPTSKEFSITLTQISQEMRDFKC